MKYNICDFSQQHVVSLTKEINGKSICLDVNDLLILQDIADLINRPSMYKYIINDKIYISIQYKAIISDLPILKIKKQALSDRINKMVLLELLEKEIIKNEQGTFSCFRIGKNYDLLKYNRGGSAVQTPIVSDYDTETTVTIKDYIKEDTNVSKKEIDSSNSASTDLNANVDTLYGLYPSKCPKRNISLGKCFKDKERLKKLLKTHSFEMLKFTIEREISEKYNKSYMANFSTFLNNLPDYGFDEKLKKQVDDKSEKINESIEIDGVTYK